MGGLLLSAGGVCGRTTDGRGCCWCRLLRRVAREQEQLRRMYEAEQSKSGGRKPGRTEDDVAAAAAGQMTPSRGPVLGGRHHHHRSRSDGAKSVDEAWDEASAMAADRPLRTDVVSRRQSSPWRVIPGPTAH